MSKVEQKQSQMKSQNLTLYFPNLINLFEVYLMLLSLTQTIWHQIIGD
jgi:hypothetical protein